LVLLERAVEPSAWMTAVPQGFPFLWLSEGQMAAGRLEDAAGTARRALDLARHRGERGCEAYALRLLGRVAAHGQPAKAIDAETAYREALKLAQTLTMRPLIAHSFADLGRLYRVTGQEVAARACLGAAAALYREMDMRFWLLRD
jgi:tetratricopeptide (TPR) repeat protein